MLSGCCPFAKAHVADYGARVELMDVACLQAQLRQLRKRASSVGQADSDLVQELRAVRAALDWHALPAPTPLTTAGSMSHLACVQNLARACADIARLTVEVDRARNVDSDKSQDYKSYQVSHDDEFPVGLDETREPHSCSYLARA